MAMRCAACGHNVSESDRRCLYCGAPFGHGDSTGPGETPGARGRGDDSPKTGKQDTTHGVSEPDGVYVNLRDLPPDLRDRITDILKEKGKGAGVDTASARETGAGAEQDPELPGHDMTLPFPRHEGGRKRRLHPLILFLIFLGSVGFVGFIMWLMM